MSGRLIELAPGQPILLIYHSDKPEQEQQFAELLETTWRRVPAVQRKVILDYYCKLHRNCPKVFVTDLDAGAATGGPDDYFMMIFDVRTIFNWPKGIDDTALVIAEELANAFMIASGHESHINSPPLTSPEFPAYNQTREDAMKEVLYSWDFIDRAAHEALCSAVVDKAKQLRKQV